MNASEIADYEDHRTIFRWRPTKDDHQPAFDKSIMLPAISERIGNSVDELIEEITRRKNVLHWMRERNIRSYKDVAAIIAEYCSRPKQIYEKILAGEEVKVVAIPRKA